MKELHLRKADFRVDWFSGSGAGGQHRNKHQNCCRITHVETGLRAVGQSHRSRQQNQREAFERLVGKLLVLYSEGSTPAERSSRVVRTYHFVRSVATDGELELPVKRVVDGDITPFIERALSGQRADRRSGRQT